MHLFKQWIVATRLETIPLAFASVGLGSALAFFTGNFNWLLGLLAALTASLLQVICNLANDYGDLEHGADAVNLIKPPSALQTGWVTLVQVRRTLPWLVGGASVAGCLLFYVAGLSWTEVLIFAFLGVLAILAALMYTLSHRPYGYRGWGDVAVFIFFGLLGVGGTFYLHTRQLHTIWLLPAMSYGSLVVGVLNVNNLRDMAPDARVGKKTIPVRIGRKAALIYHWCLLGVSIVSVLAFLLCYTDKLWPYTCLCVVPWLFRHGMAMRHQGPARLTEQLQSLVRLILIFFMFLSIGMLW